MSSSPSIVVGRSHALPLAAAIALIGSLLLGALAVAQPVNAAAVEAGYKDHSWAGSTSVSSPTQDKPQSKVWFTDGSWWGGLFTDGDNRIHRYNASTHQWTDTGVTVDPRNSSHADYLWDGATNSLYVASVNGDSDADPILVYKLNYNASTDTYSHDSAFGAGGVQVGTGPSESVTIAKDSTGQLWVTFQNDSVSGDPNSPIDIMVNRSTSNESTWGTAFSIGEAGPDDISAIIAFGGNSVGVMWSDQNPVANQTFFYWSQHADADTNDTGWSTKKSSAQGTDDFAEDHINLKLVATDSGEVLAAVKTNGGPEHVQVLRRNVSTGNWSSHLVVGDGQSVTRPQIVVDGTNARAYVLYTAPEVPSTGNQAIYYKSAPLSTLNFGTGSGLGTTLIKDGANDISDVSTSKHSVTSGMGGILAIAGSNTNKSYYHGLISLTGGGPASPFEDVPTTHRFYEDIVWIAEEGITTGCNQAGTRYCPVRAVDRDQMASFLVRALGLTGGETTDAFPDDDGNIHETNINVLAHNGLTTGCNQAGTIYCPNSSVDRDQMATFLVRAYELSGGETTDAFTDDNNNIHETNINVLAHNGLTTGCNQAGTIFCPNRTVDRDQMAAFLHRAETQ